MLLEMHLIKCGLKKVAVTPGLVAKNIRIYIIFKFGQCFVRSELSMDRKNRKRK